VIASGGYYVYRLNTDTTFVSIFEPSIIFAEKRQPIDITDRSVVYIMNIFSALSSSSSLPLGIVVDFYLTDSPISDTPVVPRHVRSTEFLKSIRAEVSDNFLTSLTASYMVGIYTLDSGNIPFIILKTSSYNYAFSGMLDWEKTMTSDLSPFFVIQKKDTLLSPDIFIDAIIQNMDVRMLRTSTGNIDLLYSFVNPSTIVITSDPRVLVELAKRVQAKTL